MARKRQPSTRSSIVGGRATLVVPVETITTAEGGAARFGELSRWLPIVRSRADRLAPAPNVSVAVDGFAFDLYVGDVAFATGVHDGAEFVRAAIEHGIVDVHVSTGIDPVRSSAAALDEVASRGGLRGGQAAAFVVDQVSD